MKANRYFVKINIFRRASMELKDMNPYLRFVQIIKYQTESEYLRAVDYHFYFMLSEYCLLKIDNTDVALQAGSAVIIPPGTNSIIRFAIV